MATATKSADGKAHAPAQPKLFPTRNDISVETRGKVITLLNQQLADTADLRTQVKHAHWNVKGRNFIGLHKLFDEQAERLDDMVDEIAERITALGGLAFGSARSVAKASRLPDFPADATDARDVEKALADRYAALAKTTRAAIDAADDLGDKDTADLFTGVSRTLDKDLWFIEAHLQSEG